MIRRFQGGFEVLTAMAIESSVFWDIMPYSPLKVNGRLGGTYCLQLQGRRRSQARHQRESRWQTQALKMGTTCSSEKSEDRLLEKLHVSAILIYHLQTFIFLMWRESFVGAILQMHGTYV
jgi:hypothetical protein